MKLFEVTKTETKIISLMSVKQPENIGATIEVDADGKEYEKKIANTNKVQFVTAHDIATGQKIRFTTTTERAESFDHSQLFAEGAEGSVFEVIVKYIPKATTDAKPAYKTRKKVDIEGVTYEKGELVPYRNEDFFVIEGVVRRLTDSQAEAERNRYKAKDFRPTFVLMFGCDYDPANEEHRKLALSILATM